MAMTGGTAVRVASGTPQNWPGSIDLYVYWLEKSQSIINNTTTISLGMFVTTPTGWYFGPWTDGHGSYVGTAVSGDNCKTFNGYCAAKTQGTVWLVENQEITISHNSNGTKSQTIYWKWGAASTWAGFSSPATGSFTITLTTISRVSAITDNSIVSIGSPCNIEWHPTSESYYYKLRFSVGSWSYTTPAIRPNTTSAYSYTGYTVPIDVVTQIANSSTGIITVTLYAYSNSSCTNQIGSVSSKSFTVSVPSTIIPTLNELSVEVDNSSNSILNNWGVAVAGYSKVKLIASGSGVYDSTISGFIISSGYSATINGEKLDYTGGVISSSGSKVFKVKCKDSRGRYSEEITSDVISFYAHTRPSISTFSVSRSSDDNTKIRILANWTFSSINGLNYTTGKLYFKKSTASSWEECTQTIENGTEVVLDSAFDETSSYNFKLIVTDALSSAVQGESFLPTLKVLLDFRSGGNGIGIGRICESDSMEVALDAKFFGTIYVNGLTLEEYIRSIINST